VIISHKKSFVMFRPWKTASSSMGLRLEPYAADLYPRFFYFNRFLNRVVHQHITCAEFACLPESRLGYISGSFVRNPYDRVYSGFRQIQEDIQKQPHADYPEPWIRDHVMRQLSENIAQLSQAHFDFDAWLGLIREDQVFDVGRNTNFPLHPAHYWSHIDGTQIIDFIGRVENFETDFHEFLLRVGIGHVQLVNQNVVDLTGGSASNPFGYRYVDRMNAKSIDKINQLFSRDFDLFGYERIFLKP
jgi:hypothetical protein